MLNIEETERGKIIELKTIRQASLDYGVSRRMLCYYEEWINASDKYDNEWDSPRRTST